MSKDDSNYCGLLYNMYTICEGIAGMEEEEKKYKEELVSIL